MAEVKIMHELVPGDRKNNCSIIYRTIASLLLIKDKIIGHRNFKW